MNRSMPTRSKWRVITCIFLIIELLFLEVIRKSFEDTIIILNVDSATLKQTVVEYFNSSIGWLSLSVLALMIAFPLASLIELFKKNKLYYSLAFLASSIATIYVACISMSPQEPISGEVLSIIAGFVGCSEGVRSMEKWYDDQLLASDITLKR